MSKAISMYDDFKKMIEDGKHLYLVAFTVTPAASDFPRTGSFVLTDDDKPLWEIYARLQERGRYPQLDMYRDQMAILTVSHIQKLS